MSPTLESGTVFCLNSLYRISCIYKMFNISYWNIGKESYWRTTIHNYCWFMCTLQSGSQTKKYSTAQLKLDTRTRASGRDSTYF